MKTDLTPRQIASYRDDGFIVIEDFLDAAELQYWRQVVDEAVGMNTQSQRDELAVAGGKGDDFYGNVFIQRGNMWRTHPKIKEITMDPRIGRMCCDLEGIDGIRMWHDQALIKRPWDNATSWHLDNPYWSFDSLHSISIWVALDDATLRNGCLYYLPGTHKTANWGWTNIGANMREIFKAYPQWARIEPVAAPMKAGSCGFHNGLTAHAAGPNMTPGWRRAMTCAYMPDGATFNGKQNMLSKEQMARYKIGDPLRDADINPLVYSNAGYS